MSFHALSSKYIKELQRTFRSSESGEATPELSYRPALDSFLRDLKNEIHSGEIEIIFEPKKQKQAGRPDWRFYHRTNLGVFGFVEAKALDIASIINPAKDADQINRYLELKQNLILTDGIDFVFYLEKKDWKPCTISLIEKPLSTDEWGNLQLNALLENAFRDFFSSPHQRECSEEQLVEQIALRAGRLAYEIAELVKLDSDAALNESERKTIQKLASLKEFLGSNHDPSLAEIKPFSDFVAQVLCFGLLYSHRSILTTGATAAQRYISIHQYWIDGLSGAVAPLRPFQELILQLKDEIEPKSGNESALSTWYDDCRHLLSYVRLTDDQRKVPDYHRLYERFLQKFDPQTRLDFGAFYTPKELASFIVSAVDQVAQRIYKESVFASENKLIDPCCGTGTFIEQILEKLSPGQSPSIVGFEILPAPYALAHYRLSLMTSLKKVIDGRVHVLLTNTLSDRLDLPTEPPEENKNRFQEEQIDARKLAVRPIILVIGNPPSSDSTKAPHQQAAVYSNISELIDDFRPPMESRGIRQNTQKQLRNDFVRFIRWSVDRVSTGDRGIIALVVPESFLEHGSYRFARKWLVENFSFIWTLDIDADQRSGTSSASLFYTLQGRALLIAARDDSEPSLSPGKIKYGSIRDLSFKDKKEQLMATMTTSRLDEVFVNEVEIDSLYRFRPSDSYDQTFWQSCWPIYSSSSKSLLAEGEHSIFVRHSSSLKLGATSLLVHSNLALLNRRTKAISNVETPFTKIREDWFSGQSKPPSEQKLNALKSSLRNAAQRNKPFPYLHRPFVNLYAVLDEEVLTALSSMPGGGARPRPEVRSAFSAVNNLAFTIAPSRKDIGVDLHRFVSFCWGIPDNDLCRRGNAQVVARLYPNYKLTRSIWDSTPKANFDPYLIGAIPLVEGMEREESLVYYSYAVLCSPAYLEEFSGALFTTASSDSVPRLPITSNAALFGSIAKLGKNLALLENPETLIELSNNRLKLLEAFQYEDSKKLHSLNQVAQGDGRRILQLVDANGTPLFSTDPIDPAVAYFRVSGYKVIDEWVKWFSYRYARIPLRKSTVSAFLHLISRVEMQLNKITELDEAIEIVLADREGCLKCPT